jgi:hypothetical protein
VVGEGGTGPMAEDIPIGLRGAGTESCCGDPPENVLDVDGVRLCPPIRLAAEGGGLPCLIAPSSE